MTYQDLITTIDQIKTDNIYFYGDFGFDFQLDWNDDNDTVANISVSWPSMGTTYIEDAFRFAEALQAFAFAGNRLVGTTVQD